MLSECCRQRIFARQRIFLTVSHDVCGSGYDLLSARSKRHRAMPGWGGHRTWLLERTWRLPGAHVRGKGWGGNSPDQTGPRLCDTRGRECLVPGRSRCRACLIWHETSASFTQSLSPAGLLGQCYLERRLYTGNEYIDNRAKLIDQDFQWLITTPDEKDGKKPGHSWTPLPAPSRVFRSSGFKI